MSKCIRVAVLLCLSPLAATAGEVYVGVGTTGAELGYAHALSPTSGVRVEGNFFSYGRDFNTDDIDYDAKLKFGNLGVFYDHFMGAGTFRLSGGALIGSRTLEGTGKPRGGVIRINGVDYPAAGESLTLDAKFPDVSPYIGIGWGHKQAVPGGGFYFDLGAAFGKPKVKLTATPGLVTAAGQGNIDAEQRKAQDEADKLKAYPVVKIGFSYVF